MRDVYSGRAIIMSNEWDEYAAGWSTDPAVQQYANKAYAELIKVVDLQGLRILDFGCGTGQLTEKLVAQADDIVALDGSAEMIHYLEQKQLQKVIGIAGFLSPDLIEQHVSLQKPFDLIVASSVCSFLADYESTLGLFKKLLKPSGVFVQWDWLLPDASAQESKSQSSFGFTRQQVKVALTGQGLANVELSQPFAMTSDKGGEEMIMPVLMAQANKV